MTVKEYKKWQKAEDKRLEYLKKCENIIKKCGFTALDLFDDKEFADIGVQKKDRASESVDKTDLRTFESRVNKLVVINNIASERLTVSLPVILGKNDEVDRMIVKYFKIKRSTDKAMITSNSRS